MEITDITCDWTHGFRDYDGSWTSESCSSRAEVRVTGYDVEGPVAPDDDAHVDVFCCAAHGDEDYWVECLVERQITPLPERYRQGYVQGHNEAVLAPMSTDTAYIFHYEAIDTEDELPSGFDARTPLSGEWADEAVDWGDEEVEDYRRGFTRGWIVGLSRHAEAIVERDQVDDGGDRLRDL
jgi:hypothetical protein